jgi:hypothetical protein
MKQHTRIFLLSLVCVLIFVNGHFLITSADESPTPSWRTKASMPTSRGQLALLTGDDGLLYAIGGHTGVGPGLTTVEAYDPQMDAWTTKASLLHSTRGAAAAKGSDGLLYVISGYNTSYVTSVQVFNVSANSWALASPIPYPVWIACAVAGNDGNIYVFGGEMSGMWYSNRTQIYHPSTDTWTTGADLPTGRQGACAVQSSEGLIYVMGGTNGATDRPLSVVEVYDPTTDSWSTTTPMPSPKALFAAVLGPDNMIYTFGGSDRHVISQDAVYEYVEVYNPNTGLWTIPGWRESRLPTPRKELSASQGLNGRVYVIGGWNVTYLNIAEEASIPLPVNTPPQAFIDSITPNPAVWGESVTFAGNGVDFDGVITAVQWRSSLDGILSTVATFSSSSLSNGTHTIYLTVKDDSDTWSLETSATVMILKPYTDDPLYQELEALNDDFATQLANLTAHLESLTQRVDQQAVQLIASSGIIIVLLAVILVLRFRGQP